MAVYNHWTENWRDFNALAVKKMNHVIYNYYSDHCRNMC